MATIKVIMLTYNAGSGFDRVLAALLKQKGISPVDILVIDSSSTDGTIELVQKAGISLCVIAKETFGHGKTRQLALAKQGKADVVIYLTQDALLADEDAILSLCRFLEQEEQLAAAFAQQIPYPEMSCFSQFARFYNYGDKSYIRSFADRKKYGIKTVFFSDCFAAYKTKYLQAVGGFMDVSFGEDTCMAAKLLMAGYKVGYCAQAKAYHSHNYSLREDFARYRVIGKFHKQQAWLLDTFGKAGGEGIAFVRAEIEFLNKNGKQSLLPLALVRNMAKFIGYRIGLAGL